MINVETHQPLLLDILKRTSKPVLELGAGFYSTKQIHTLASASVVTIEDSRWWLNRFIHLSNAKHKFLLFDQKGMFNYFDKDKTEWGLVFVDSTTWEQRIKAIERYKDTADYFVIHDVEETSACVGYFGEVIEGKRSFNKHFKYWAEFASEELPIPTTLLASNRIDIREIEVKGMRKISESI